MVVTMNYQLYEHRKRTIAALNLPPDDYEAAVRQLAEQLERNDYGQRRTMNDPRKVRNRRNLEYRQSRQQPHHHCHPPTSP